MDERTGFLPDNFQTAAEQNLALSQHLTGPWFDYNIVTIKRINIGSTSGWQVIYRE